MVKRSSTDQRQPARAPYALRLSERRVSELRREWHCCPKPAVVVVRVRPGSGLTRGLCCNISRSNQTDLQAQRTRLTRARADRAELELRRRAGELVEVRAALSKEIRQALEALADTLNSGGPIRMTSLSPLWRLSRIGRLGVHSMDTRGLDVFLAVRELWVSRQRPAAGGASPTRPPHHVET